MQRHRADGPLEALAAGREHLIEEAAQSWRTARRDVPRERAVRGPAAGSEVPVPAPLPRATARGELLGALRSRQALRRAILLHEILGPPQALERSDGATG